MDIPPTFHEDDPAILRQIMRGFRKKPTHEIDDVLAECDGLAWDEMRLDPS